MKDERKIYIGRLPESTDNRFETFGFGDWLYIKKIYQDLIRESNETVVLVFGMVRGGELLEALDFAKCIRESGVPTFAYACEGSLIASSAVFVFVACEKRRSHPVGVQILIHPQSYRLNIRAPMIRKIRSGGVITSSLRKELKKISFPEEKAMREILIAQTGLSKEMVNHYLSLPEGDAIFSIELALKYRLIHETGEMF